MNKGNNMTERRIVNHKLQIQYYGQPLDVSHLPGVAAGAVVSIDLEVIKSAGARCKERYFRALRGSAYLTGRTSPVAFSVANEHDLLATVEARLTEEMERLASELIAFSGRVLDISEEIPEGANFSQSVSLLLSLFSLQLANSLFQNSDTPLLVDDGAQYLAKLGLSLEDFFREISLDGRRFLAVALIDETTNEAADVGEISEQV